MPRIALLGCGNVASIISRRRASAETEIVAVHDKLPARAESLANDSGATICASVDKLLEQDVDCVVEVASVEAVTTYAEDIVEAGQDLIILSVGALADKKLLHRLETAARATGATLRIPSGAIFGLDNLKIGRLSRLDRLFLRTTKPTGALGVKTKEPILVFRGDATACIRHYPRHINVAVALELATNHDVEVEIWVDPAASSNRHEIFVSGEFGEAEFRINNLPSPDNPTTSYLAALSILVLLKEWDSPFRVGT